MPVIPGAYAYTGLEAVRWDKPLLEALIEESDRIGAQRVLIVASPSLRSSSNQVDLLAERLGDRCIGIFDELQPHTPIPCARALHCMAKDCAADLLVTLGGGTPIDTSKVVLAMLAAGVSDPMAVADQRNGWTLPPIRQIACPTTLSGAEYSDVAGLTDPDTRIKHMVMGRGIGPAVVVLDPKMAAQTPVDLWTSTGLRAVDHAVETICSIAPTRYTSLLALGALEALPSALRASAGNPADPQSRLEGQLAAWMASAGLNRTPYGASHGIGHQLGAVAGVPHGLCSCTVLPAVLDWNLGHTVKAQAEIARALSSRAAAGGVRQLVADLKLPSRLSDVGVKRDQLVEIAQKSVPNRWVRANPRPIQSHRDILEILEAAF
ncbi:MAG: iron-containing alcohol dehydrogenase [Pseudomonadota bacterium]